MADINALTGISPQLREFLDGLSPAELDFLDGAIAGTVVASKALVVDSSKDLASLRHLTLAGNVLVGGAVQDASGNSVIAANGNAALGTISGSTLELTSTVNASGNVTSGGSFIIGGASMDETDLEKLDGITNGTGAAAKCLVLDASSCIDTIVDIGCVDIVASGTIASDTFTDACGTTLTIVNASGNVTASGTIHATGNVSSSGSFVIGGADMNETDLEKLDGITNGTGAAAKCLVLDASSCIDTIVDIGCVDVVATGTIHAGGNVSSSGEFVIGSASMNEADLEKLDGITDGTAAASKALVLDASSTISGIVEIDSTKVTVGSGTIRVVKTTLTHDSSATATETALCTVPEDSMILDVAVKTIVAFDGSATTTCEVGINGNIDKYIDAADWDASVHNDTINMYGSTTSDTALPEFVSAAMAIVFTSTNTGTVGAGQIEGIVTYIELDFSAD